MSASHYNSILAVYKFVVTTEQILQPLLHQICYCFRWIGHRYLQSSSRSNSHHYTIYLTFSVISWKIRGKNMKQLLQLKPYLAHISFLIPSCVCLSLQSQNGH